MDLAGREGKVDAVVGDDAGEPLDDAAELDGRRRAGDGREILSAHLRCINAGGRLVHALAPSGIDIATPSCRASAARP